MSTAATSATDASARVQPGDILAGRYRVEQVLGSGGMGVVVAAEHIELREKVAIKFLLDEAADNPELAERFLREARAAVKIKSEHVVRIIDVGRLPSNAPYMVMEYLAGEDLSQTLVRGRVAIEDAVDYVIQSCEAMNVAHRSGIVHRDLKPANLFLTQRPDGSPIIKVLDFGISKVTSPEAAQLSLTQTQTMMGSPLYMSPEQMRSSKDVDRRTDIWALGVILHELISGDVPFSGTTFPEVLMKVMTEPAPGLRSLRPEVPEALEAVVLRCLAKAPGDRHSSVAALAVALAPFASGRTLGLQSRLQHSMSEPPRAVALAPLPAPVLLSTRIEVGSKMLDLPLQTPGDAGTLPSIGSAQGAVLQAGTNTAWEGQSQQLTAVQRRPRRLAWAVGLGLVALLGLAVTRWMRPSSSADTDRDQRVAPAAAPTAAPVAAPSALSVAVPAVPASAPTSPEPSVAVLPSDAPQLAQPSVAPAPPVSPQKRRVAAPRVKTRPAPAAARNAPRTRAELAPTPRPADPPHAPRARPKPLSIEFK